MEHTPAGRPAAPMWTWVLEVEAPCLVGLLRRRRLAVSQPTRAAVQAAAGVASANHSDMLPSARLVTRNTSPHRSSFDRRQTTDGWSRTLPLPGSNTLVNVPLALATGGKHNSCVNRPAGAARACDHHVRGWFLSPSFRFLLARAPGPHRESPRMRRRGRADDDACSG